MKLRELLRNVRERRQERAEQGRLGWWRRSVVGPAEGGVLEIGAGMGFSYPLLARASTVAATDSDVDALRRGKKRAARSPANVWLVAADAERLPFRARVFDGAVGTLVFCTIPEPARALDELLRVVRPGGAVRLLEHVRASNPLLGKLQDWMTPLWKRLAGGCHPNRRTVETLMRSELRVRAVRPHLGGHVVEVDAAVPDAP